MPVEWTAEATGDYVALVEEPIAIATSIDMVRSPQAGAVSTFLGTTRDTFEGKQVTSLSYESYTEMAIESLKEMCQKIRQKWMVTKIALVHKLGDCPIGEVSVLIAISSAHRTESLEAVHYAIDELKRTVPIWKKVR
jgi:molybdopterin synthase catalytic subunit